MKIELTSGELYLREHCPLRLTDAAGFSIRCTHGVLWMTITGEAGDIVLASGESHRIRSPGRIVIESLGGPARIRFERNSLSDILSRLKTMLRKPLSKLEPSASQRLA